MKTKIFLQEFVVIFCITLVVSVVVSYLYSLIVHGSGVLDWQLAFRLALIFAIVFPLSRLLK